MVRFAAITGAIGLAAFTLTLILSRLPVKFDHDWVESTVVRSIHQIMNHRSMYAAPSAEFVGDAYPPFFFHLCAALTPFSGNALITARVLSLVATTFVALALLRISSDRRRLTGRDNQPIWIDQLERFLPPALLLAFYAASGQTFDLARVDMTALALAAWAAVLALKSESTRGAILAGLLMAAAILTKHNIIMIGAAIGAGWLLYQPRRAILFGVTALTIPAVVLFMMHRSTHGWSTFHLFEQLSHNPFGGRARWIRFFAVDVGWHGVLMAGMLSAAFFAIWHGPADRPAFNRRRLIAVTAIVGGGLAMTISGRQKVGGFPNNLVPAWTFALFALAWCLPRVRAVLREADARRRSGWHVAASAGLLVIVISLGLTCSRIPLRRYLASGERQAAVAELQKLVDEYTPAGPVWMPAHSGVMPGADAYAHLCPIGFTVDTPDFPIRTMIEKDITTRLSRQHWSAIILDDPRDKFITPAIWKTLLRNYEERPWPIRNPERLNALTGKITRPGRLFVRRTAPLAPPSSLIEEPTRE